MESYYMHDTDLKEAPRGRGRSALMAVMVVTRASLSSRLSIDFDWKKLSRGTFDGRRR